MACEMCGKEIPTGELKEILDQQPRDAHKGGFGAYQDWVRNHCYCCGRRFSLEEMREIEKSF